MESAPSFDTQKMSVSAKIDSMTISSTIGIASSRIARPSGIAVRSRREPASASRTMGHSRAGAASAAFSSWAAAVSSAASSSIGGVITISVPFLASLARRHSTPRHDTRATESRIVQAMRGASSSASASLRGPVARMAMRRMPAPPPPSSKVGLISISSRSAGATAGKRSSHSIAAAA